MRRKCEMPEFPERISHRFPHRTLKIPFKSAQHADIARRVILVDRELNGHLVERTLVVQDNILIAYAFPPPLKTSLIRCAAVRTAPQLSDFFDSPQTDSSRTCSL